MRLSRLLAVALALTSICATARSEEYLVKLKHVSRASVIDTLGTTDGQFELVSGEGQLFKFTTSQRSAVVNLKNHPNVAFVQKNHAIFLFKNPSIVQNGEAIVQELLRDDGGFPGMEQPAADNPDIQSPPVQLTGADPILGNAWGITNVNAKNAWNLGAHGSGVIVAVTDTGVDYNHEDLIANMWRNSKEVAGDNIDNDNNGYVDDVVGYDFAANDNKPYDLMKSLFEILMGQGNPGHGTHCSGVVGAKSNNGVGLAGVAPGASIMGLRFINESGQGDTAGAIKAIDYAVANGAKVISASWGSEGIEEGDDALKEAIQRAGAKGVLFVVAAGNGRNGVGYNNDTDPKPVYPASYTFDNMITVAAIDSKEAIAPFSNFGKVSVDIGAPGVKVLSTVPGNKYQDTIIDLGEFLHATWDGTSMATPHVAGAAAAIWSKDPSLTMEQVRQLILSNSVKIGALQGKVSTDGRLDLSFLK